MAHWQPMDGGVQKLAGHDVDYLIYRMPLTGNFEVETDLSTGSGVNGAMMVAGIRFETMNGGKATMPGDSFRAGVV